MLATWLCRRRLGGWGRPGGGIRGRQSEVVTSKKGRKTSQGKRHKGKRTSKKEEDKTEVNTYWKGNP